MSLRDDDLVLEPTTGSDDFTGFAVVVDGDRRGTVGLHHDARGIASIRWGTDDAGMPITIRALRLALDHAFTELGLDRVEVRLPVDDVEDVRSASLAGLRREGLLRMPGDEPDHVVMARLAADPAPLTREAFVAVLNAGLPTKRVISQGVMRDEHGRVLLCELTYKREWDLPGGVVEVGEAPGEGLVRELEEELGVSVAVRGLITVNWLPAWREWDDACVFVFDLGTVDSSVVKTWTLQPSEIAAVHWCDVDDLHARGTAASIELLDALRDGGVPHYREAPKAPE